MEKCLYMTIQKIDFDCHLKNRAIIEIKGSDKEALLQGIITQDIKNLETQPIIYSLMLSPQGKFQFDFFIINIGKEWLIDINVDRVHAFLQRLQLFKLRSDVNLKINLEWQVGVSSTKAKAINCFLDPRLKDLGYRIYDKKIFSCESDEAYESLRLGFAIPDGARDMIIDKSIPLEWGMDELHAISWNKGCYMGQELTARSKYVGQIRKRTFPITFEISGEYKIGEKLYAEDKEVGELRAISGLAGIALLKLEALQSQIMISNYPIKVHKPSWMILPIN